MFKKVLIAVCACFLIAGNVAIAQKAASDTGIFFMKNSGKIVRTKDSADFILFTMPVDSSSGQKLYPLIEYYLNGKIKQVEYVKQQQFTKVLNGPFQSYQSNGKRDVFTNYVDGAIDGDYIKYFPNGSVYYIEKGDAKERQLWLVECHDTTGRVISENGNGKWFVYDSKFRFVDEIGDVKNGLREGSWQSTEEGAKVVTIFNQGSPVSRKYYDESNREVSGIKVPPQYPGGPEAFRTFIKNKMSYPATRQNTVHTGQFR